MLPAWIADAEVIRMLLADGRFQELAVYASGTELFSRRSRDVANWHGQREAGFRTRWAVKVFVVGVGVGVGVGSHCEGIHSTAQPPVGFFDQKDPAKGAPLVGVQPDSDGDGIHSQSPPADLFTEKPKGVQPLSKGNPERRDIQLMHTSTHKGSFEKVQELLDE